MLFSNPDFFCSDWFKTWRKIIFQRVGLISVCLTGISLKCAPYEALKLSPGDPTAAWVTEFTSAPLYFLWIWISLPRHSKWNAGKVSGCFKRRSWWDLDILFSVDALNSLLRGQTLFGPFLKIKSGTTEMAGWRTRSPPNTIHFSLNVAYLRHLFIYF